MRLLTPILALGLAGLNSVAYAQSAEEIFAERSLAMALDTQCGLFSDAERAALDAARLQARGALLRSGIPSQRLREFSQQIESETRTRPCLDQETLDIRDRVTSAFSAYRLIPSMSFPGENYGWEADRMVLLAETGWVILQDTGDIRIGVAGIDEDFMFTIAPTSNQVFSAAILVLRDMDKAPELYDPTAGGLFDGPTEAPWARWTPPDHARRTIWASNKVSSESSGQLTDTVSQDVFRFPDSAALEMAERDPRETARIDFLDNNGDRAASSYIEIGDFGAALAFIQAVLPEDTDS